MQLRSLRTIGRDTSGNILIITGLSFLILFAVAGSAYDLGHQQLVKQRMQQASDAAALAGAGLPMGSTNAQRSAVANSFFSLNYPTTYFGVGRPAPIVTVSNTAVTVEANADVPTSFVGHFRIDLLPAVAKSVTQIKRNFNKVDLILVMDNSYSMRKTDVGSVAGSSLDGDIPSMINACFTQYSNPAMIAALGGFNFTAPTNYCTYPYLDATYANWGFVGLTRINALRYVADLATNKLLTASGTDNRVALVKWNNLLQGFHDFSNDYNALRPELMNMFAGGNTVSTLGIQKAIDLSANFRPDAVHVIILLTDGLNSSNGQEQAADAAIINAATIPLCTALKSQPQTLLYTVAFGQDVSNPVIGQFLSDCATGPNGTGNPKPNENQFYYVAPDAAALSAAFTQILGNLKKVQIVQ